MKTKTKLTDRVYKKLYLVELSKIKDVASRSKGKVVVVTGRQPRYGTTNELVAWFSFDTKCSSPTNVSAKRKRKDLFFVNIADQLPYAIRYKRLKAFRKFITDVLVVHNLGG